MKNESIGQSPVTTTPEPVTPKALRGRVVQVTQGVPWLPFPPIDAPTMPARPLVQDADLEGEASSANGDPLLDCDADMAMSIAELRRHIESSKDRLEQEEKREESDGVQILAVLEADPKSFRRETTAVVR